MDKVSKLIERTTRKLLDFEYIVDIYEGDIINDDIEKLIEKRLKTCRL